MRSPESMRKLASSSSRRAPARSSIPVATITAFLLSVPHVRQRPDNPSILGAVTGCSRRVIRPRRLVAGRAPAGARGVHRAGVAERPGFPEGLAYAAGRGERRKQRRLRVRISTSGAAASARRVATVAGLVPGLLVVAAAAQVDEDTHAGPPSCPP